MITKLKSLLLGETLVLNEYTRADAPGKFARLSDGFTHYELGGAADGDLVVLVHGFSVPAFIWDPTFAFLSNAGFRVLRYDLFGRGYSDRPHVRYHMPLFVTQLFELLAALQLSTPINLFGLSMGGAIASAFTATHPEKVMRLGLIAPVGGKALKLTGILKGALLTGIGDIGFRLLGTEKLVNGIASDFYDPQNIPAFTKRYAHQMQFKGFKRAILSTLRSNMLGDYSENYRRIGQAGIPVLLVWGRQDNTVPYQHSEILCQAMPQTRLHTIENSGHIPHYEHPEQVNPILLDFLHQ